MGKSKLKSSLILILILSIFGTYLSCKKIDNHSSNSSEAYIAQVENRFLNEHSSSDPTILTLIDFVKRKNDKNHFISKTVERIGYPYWDKSLSIKKQSISGTIKKNIMGTSNNESVTDTAKSVDIYYVPFVRDAQNYVNASMVIKASATDTSFYYLCDWQYQDKPHGLTATNTNAEGYAVFFMMLDNRTLGHTDFNIKDPGLFPKSNSLKKKLSFIMNPVKNKSTNDVYYVRECLSYNICGTPDICRDRGGCDYELGCSVCYSGEFCHGWFEYSGSSSTGNSNNTGSGNTGSNSGGGGGSTGNNNNNTPPDCSDPDLKHSGGCEEGWEPEETFDPYFANQVIIDTSISNNFPCIKKIIDSLESYSNINALAQVALKNVFGINQRLNLTIKANPIWGKQDIDGDTNADSSFVSSGDFYGTIRLNPWVLKHATQEYIAATLIHEAIHAYIDFKYLEYRSNIIDSNTFKTLFPLYWPPKMSNGSFLPPGNNSQHNTMAANLIEIMTNPLKSLFPNQSITTILRDSIYHGLSWGGLGNTAVFSTRSDSLSIRAINAMSRDTSIHAPFSINNMSTVFTYDSHNSQMKIGCQ